MSAWELSSFALLFALLTVVSAHRYRSWLAPAPIWNASWSVLFFATATLGYGFNSSPGAVLSLVLLLALFNLPGFVLNSTVPRPTNSALLIVAAPPTWLLLVAATIGFVGVAQLSFSLGTSIFSVRSLDQLFSLGQQNAATIFRGEASFSVATNVTFAVLQCGAALAGLRVALRSTRGAAFSTIALLAVAFVWSSVTTQRSYLLVPVVWFVAGYVAAIVARGLRRPPLRAVLVAAGLGLGLLLLVVFLRSVRTNGSDAGLTEASFAPTRLWLAGYIPTFSAWFEQAEATSFSAGLLGGIIALVQPILGIRVQDDGQGVFYSIGSSLTSNAGTVMMTVVGSGGIVWGSLVVVALGLLAHLVYRRAAAGNVVATVGYVGVLAAILWATNAWFFGYGGRVMALLLLLGLAVFAARRAKQRTGNHGLRIHSKRHARKHRGLFAVEGVAVVGAAVAG